MLSPVIRINEDKCTNCHMCISVCPVKFCIDGSGEKVTINHDLCIGCAKCIDACTQRAREVIDDTAAAFSALESGTPMIAVAAPAMISSFREQSGNLLGWLKAQGIAAVFDVSFGAELTVKSYLDYIGKKNPAMVIAQPCPAIVSYIELYQPELLPMLAPADSPMLHTIKMVKTFYPQYKNHRVMVISPCIAKRREFDDTGYADYNVTIAEIMRKIKNSGIRLSSYESAGFDNPPAERAALFSSPGGLMKTVLREKPEIGDRIRKIEGPAEIYDYLKELPEALKKGYNPLLVDCLNCSKGCNGGPGTLNKTTPIDELEHIIRSRAEKLKKNYSRSGNDRTSRRKLNRLLNKYWNDDLYSRTYTDRSATARVLEPDQAELAKIYRGMLKETEEDHLNCASCGYNSCELMAKAIFNGLNKTENCHHYRRKMMEMEKDTIDSINIKLTEKIQTNTSLISNITEALGKVNSNMDDQSQSLQSSSASIEQMMASVQSLSDNFSAQSSNLQNLVTKARNGEHEMKLTTSAIGKITEDVSRIGDMIGMIDDISQRTNLLSMNAAIEAAHAGTAGRGFAVVASEIKKLAENTASKAGEVGSSLSRIITDAGSTGESSGRTSDFILEMIGNILQLMEVMNTLLNEVQQLSDGSSSIMDAIGTLKSDNHRVVSSATEINTHISDLQKNMHELVSISNESGGLDPVNSREERL